LIRHEVAQALFLLRSSLRALERGGSCSQVERYLSPEVVAMTHIERSLAKQLQSSVKFVLIAFCGLGAVSSSISATSAYTINDRQNNRVYRRNPQTKRTAGASSPVVVGRASWYGNSSAGRKTATGERLDPRQLTAASLQLPLKSQAVVTNLDNGRSVKVRINDCGPYTRGRKLDLSKRAAQELAMTHEGTAPVRIRLVAKPPDASYCKRPASTGRVLRTRRGLRSDRKIMSR
jgi:rare lipoprotein A